MKLTREQVVAQAEAQLVKDLEWEEHRNQRRLKDVKKLVEDYCKDVFDGFLITNCEKFTLVKFSNDSDWTADFIYDGFHFQMFDGGERWQYEQHTRKLYVKKRWGWKRIRCAEQFLDLVRKGKV